MEKQNEIAEQGGENAVSGEFVYEQDSKRFHRFRVVAEEGLVGTIYIPKALGHIPRTITLQMAADKPAE